MRFCLSSGWFLLEPCVFVLQSFLLDPNLPVREEAAQDCRLPRQKQWKVGQNNKRAKNNTIHRFYSRFYDAGKSVVGDPDLGQILASLIGVVGYMSEMKRKNQHLWKIQFNNWHKFQLAHVRWSSRSSDKQTNIGEWVFGGFLLITLPILWRESET